MKRIVVLLALVLALTCAALNASVASGGRQIGPGDGDLGCDQSNLGYGVSWPDGSYHVCAWLQYRGFYWT